MQDGRTDILSFDGAASHEERERMIWRKPVFVVEGAGGVTLQAFITSAEGEFVGS